MAIARMLPTNLFFIPAFSKLGETAKLAYIGLLLHADDEGRNHADKRTLARTLDIYDCYIEDALRQLAEHKLIQLYEVEGEQYYQITNWKQMQTIHHLHPSKLPTPPESTATTTEKIDDPASAKEPSAETTPLNNININDEKRNESYVVVEDNHKDKAMKALAEEEQLAEALQCSRAEINHLVGEFPSINIIGEYHAAHNWYEVHKKPFDLGMFRRWLHKAKTNPDRKRAGTQKKESPYKAMIEADE